MVAEGVHRSYPHNLVGVEAPKHRVEMDYDALGRRQSKRVYRGRRLERNISYLYTRNVVVREIDEVTGNSRTYLRLDGSWAPLGHVDVIDGVESVVYYGLGQAEASTGPSRRAARRSGRHG